MDTPDFADRLSALETGFLARPHALFIDNQWVAAQAGGAIEIINPATGGALATVAAGEAADVDLAVRAARRAFAHGPWAKMRSVERAGLLLRLADAIEANADEFALIETLDGGNPIRSTRHVDIMMAIASVRYHAGWANKVTGQTPMSQPQLPVFSYTVREPVGVVGAITPWNAPLLMAVNKLSPALAMGCTAVLKPAELAPLSALRLGQLIEHIGFPPGVVNIITGYGDRAGQALVDHGDVNKISFTGSTRVGKSILAGSTGNLKRVTLELGGKSPIIVCADADLERAALAIAKEICFKTGQYCAAGTRLFAHGKVIDRVLTLIADHMQKTKIGAGILPDTDMGPIISQKQLDRVMTYIDAGTNDGCEIVTGGRRIDSAGYFVQPTLMRRVQHGMSVFRDEIFGPVLVCVPFADDAGFDQIAALANDTSYGLSAKLWTRDLSTAHSLARRINAGQVIINGGGTDAPMPFGGFNQSGLGRENGSEGVLAYTEIKSVQIGL